MSAKTLLTFAFSLAVVPTMACTNFLVTPGASARRFVDGELCG